MANFSATVDLGGDETIVKNVQDNAFSPATVAAKSKVLMCAKHPGIWVCQAYFGLSQKIRDCPHCIAEFSAKIGDISPVSVVSNSNVSTSVSSSTNTGNSPTINNSSKSVAIDASESLSRPTCESIYDLAKNNKWDEVLTIFKSDERLARKAVKYVKPSSGWSLLHQAAYWGDRAAIEACLEYGSDTVLTNSKGRTSFHIAEERGNTEVYVAALEFYRSKQEDRDNELYATIYTFGKNGQWDKVKESILSMSESKAGRAIRWAKPSSGWTLLHQAACFGDKDAVRFCLEFEADPTALTKKEKETPLQMALRKGQTDRELWSLLTPPKK
jgi:ankyrin repeat protein